MKTKIATCEEFTFISTGEVIACTLPTDHANAHAGKWGRKYWHSWEQEGDDLKEPTLK